jgi:hypothetical protein
MTLNIILDIVVSGLLLTTIAYAILLSRRLGALRNDKQQLEALVASLDGSSHRAEAGIAALKEAAERIGQQLQQRVDQGKALQGDLSYIIDLGGGLADRLEGTIRARRDDTRAAPELPEATPRRRAATERPIGERSIGERLATERLPERNVGERAVVERAVGAARETLRGHAVAEETAPAAEPVRIADFATRAERLLRGALEARR